MRRTATVLGWITLTPGVLLILIGLSTLPSGGLMFAVPYVLLMPGIILVAVGGVLLRLGRRPNDGRPGDGSAQ